MKTVWRVFAYLKRYPALAASTLACAIFGTLMVIVFPAVTKSIVDEVVIQRREERLMPLVLFAALAFLLQHGLNALRIILNNTFEQRVIFDLCSDLYSHIQLLPLRCFDNRATGDLMTRVVEDVNSVERVLIDEKSNSSQTRFLRFPELCRADKARHARKFVFQGFECRR
jgi:ATP-binding cassette, subfamily B, bacterial